MSQEIDFTNKIEPAQSQIKYCLYARKSSEDDERQALSIDSQVKEMVDLAQVEGLLVTDIRRESHSAKSSSTRPVFNELVSDVRKGLFSGILTWSPDRMSRNAGDLGLLVDLMDNGYLKEIRTHSQALTNSPNDKFLLMILCSQAKLENDNRGINVKRGQRAKCEMGVRPNLTPLGYLNDHYSGKGQKKVFQDPERAPVIKQMFEKAAYEGYSGRKIYDWLKNETNFRSRGGYILGLSNIYKILNNPYYCGLFSFSGKWYKGSYEPIITRELFDAVQKKMITAPKSNPGTKQFDFTRMFKCGGCSSGITAQERIKRLKSGELKSYIYYHCTQFKNYDCKEPYIREDNLIEQLSLILKDIPVPEILSRPILKPELDKFMLIHRRMQDRNDLNNPTEIQPDFDLTGFIEYIFRDGTREQKRELISCLNRTICIKQKRIYCSIEITF